MEILIADDQRLLRESFKNIIENNSDIKVVACAANGKEAFELCAEYNPNVVLMDIRMPVCTGTEATKLIKSKYPHINILVLTSSDDESDVAEAISSGASGYILKNASVEELLLSLRCASLGLQIIHKDVLKSNSVIIAQSNEKGNSVSKKIMVHDIPVTLSDRDISIIDMIVNGYNNKEIGTKLFVAEGTIKNLVTEIISKLQLKDRTQLAVFAVKNNLV